MESRVIVRYLVPVFDRGAVLSGILAYESQSGGIRGDCRPCGRHRIQILFLARLRIRTEDAVVSAVLQIVPVDILICFTPIDGVAAVIHADEGAVACEGIQLFVSGFIHELAIDQEVIISSQFLDGDLFGSKALKVVGLLAKTELRTALPSHILLEPKITTAPFAVTVVAQVPVSVANRNRPVVVAVNSELCLPLRTERTSFRIAVMMIYIGICTTFFDVVFIRIRYRLKNPNLGRITAHVTLRAIRPDMDAFGSKRNVVALICNRLIRHGVGIHDDREVIPAPVLIVTCCRTGVTGDPGYQHPGSASDKIRAVAYIYHRVDRKLSRHKAEFGLSGFRLLRISGIHHLGAVLTEMDDSEIHVLLFRGVQQPNIDRHRRSRLHFMII